MTAAFKSLRDTRPPKASKATAPLSNLTRYEHTVRTDKTVCPDLVDVETFGYHRSAVTKTHRIWAFESAEGAELFLIYANRGEFRRPKKKGL